MCGKQRKIHERVHAFEAEIAFMDMRVRTEQLLSESMLILLHYQLVRSSVCEANRHSIKFSHQTPSLFVQFPSTNHLWGKDPIKHLLATEYFFLSSRRGA